MRIACFSFTEKGGDLGKTLEKLAEGSDRYKIVHFPNSTLSGGVKGMLHRAWKEYQGLIFISATGIAVRLINPFIKDKTRDPAVVVIDDMGKFSISLLSGHIGGANPLAQFIASMTGAIPVITTASDNRGIESIDLFAQRNNYYMEDRNSITSITAMMVDGKKIGFYSEKDEVIDYDNLAILHGLDDLEPSIDGLILVTSRNMELDIPYTILRPKNIHIGIGCRKGIEGKRIIEGIKQAMDKANLSSKSIKAMGTVEVKKDEQGIIEAAKYFNCPLMLFTIEEIKRVEGKFAKSQFVKDTIGVYSVSEPTAYLLGGDLIIRKSTHNGITISIAKEIDNG